MKGDYTLLEGAIVPTLLSCPCCGSKAQAWRYKESESTTTVSICCSNGEPIGPQEQSGGITSTGCVLYMPPGEFYRPRIKDAAAYWNAYVEAISQLRRKNSWAEKSSLRSGGGQS